MFLNNDLETKIQNQEIATQELAMRIEALNGQIEELMKELNVTAEQLTIFLQKKENFTEDNWNEITRQRQEFQERLTREISNIRQPLKTKKTYSERQVPQHWLFVR